MAVRRGRSERRGEAYPQGYVEPLSDARTKLADIFSILLNWADPIKDPYEPSRALNIAQNPQP